MNKRRFVTRMSLVSLLTLIVVACAQEVAPTPVVHVNETREVVIVEKASPTPVLPTLEVLRMEGLDDKGIAVVFAKLTPMVNANSARLIINGKIHSQIAAFQGGEFQLTLDQNKLSTNDTLNKLAVEVTIGDKLISAQFTAEAFSKLVGSGSQYLSYSFLGEGLPLCPIPIEAKFDLRYVGFTWSVPATGYIAVVWDQDSVTDASFLLLYFPKELELQGYSAKFNASMSWTPDGPSDRSMGIVRDAYLVDSPNYLGAEPGRNWWFVPGNGKGKVQVNVVLENSAGNVPGYPLVNILIVDFPSSYIITLYTGKVDGAGTDADVFITLYGSSGTSDEFELDNPGDDREWGAVDIYHLEIKKALGELKNVRIRHSNSGDGPGWYLEKINIKHEATGREWVFPCDRWLATDEGDQKIDIALDAK
jgi:hypothetical protein